MRHGSPRSQPVPGAGNLTPHRPAPDLPDVIGAKVQSPCNGGAASRCCFGSRVQAASSCDPTARGAFCFRCPLYVNGLVVAIRHLKYLAARVVAQVIGVDAVVGRQIAATRPVLLWRRFADKRPCQALCRSAPTSLNNRARLAAGVTVALPNPAAVIVDVAALAQLFKAARLASNQTASSRHHSNSLFPLVDDKAILDVLTINGHRHAFARRIRQCSHRTGSTLH